MPYFPKSPEEPFFLTTVTARNLMILPDGRYSVEKNLAFFVRNQGKHRCFVFRYQSFTNNPTGQTYRLVLPPSVSPYNINSVAHQINGQF